VVQRSFSANYSQSREVFLPNPNFFNPECNMRLSGKAGIVSFCPLSVGSWPCFGAPVQASQPQIDAAGYLQITGLILRTLRGAEAGWCFPCWPDALFGAPCCPDVGLRPRISASGVWVSQGPYQAEVFFFESLNRIPSYGQRHFASLYTS
jgi:hypothetical protein